jgi:hypothetical protein
LGFERIEIESLTNHWGKMTLRWVCWNLMMKGLDLLLEPQMNLAVKREKPLERR